MLILIFIYIASECVVFNQRFDNMSLVHTYTPQDIDMLELFAGEAELTKQCSVLSQPINDTYNNIKIQNNNNIYIYISSLVYIHINFR